VKGAGYISQAPGLARAGRYSGFGNQKNRGDKGVFRGLKALQEAARREEENLMPNFIECVKQ